jgi:hypothetical protein
VGLAFHMASVSTGQHTHTHTHRALHSKPPRALPPRAYVMLLKQRDSFTYELCLQVSRVTNKVIPVQAVEALRVAAPTFSGIRLIDGGKVVSPTRRPAAITHFC